MTIKNKQTNLLWKTDSGSGSSLEKSTPALLLISKIVKSPAGVYSDTPAPVHLCWLAQGDAALCLQQMAPNVLVAAIHC